MIQIWSTIEVSWDTIPIINTFYVFLMGFHDMHGADP